MLRLNYVTWLTVTTLTVFSACACGQSYPNRPLRIVTSGVGGSADFWARMLAQRLTEDLGQPVIIDNRGNFAGEIVAKGLPDGYTLLADGSSVWFAPLIQKMTYDPIGDFSPISITATSPNLVVVNPSSPAKSIKELIAVAKAKPGALNYASGNTGASTHLAGELFKSMAGVDMVRIPYNGAAPALNALLGNQVQVMFPTSPSATPHVKAGRLLALAVTSAQASALFPGLVTVAAAGLPGYEAGSFDSLSAPAKTPQAVIKRLNEEIVHLLTRAEIKERLLTIGIEAVGSSPAELATQIKSDIAKWGKIIRDSAANGS